MNAAAVRIRALLLSAMGTIGAWAAPAQADLSEIDWIVGASVGYSEFRFRPKIDSSLAFPSYDLSVAASWRKLYATAVYGGSMQDANVSEEDASGNADRRDFDVTVGWQIGRGFGVFAGYKDGSTRLRLEPREEDDEELAPFKERYGQEGPYFGASYSHYTERYGIFGVSVAYAMLDADNQFVADGDGADEGELPEFDDLTGSVNGDADGFSYGVSWTRPLGAELLYRASLKINDYEQDLSFEGQRFDSLDQRFVSFMMGVSYVF